MMDTLTVSSNSVFISCQNLGFSQCPRHFLPVNEMSSEDVPQITICPIVGEKGDPNMCTYYFLQHELPSSWQFMSCFPNGHSLEKITPFLLTKRF